MTYKPQSNIPPESRAIQKYREVLYKIMRSGDRGDAVIVDLCKAEVERFALTAVTIQ